MNENVSSLVDGAPDEERARGLLRRHGLPRDEALVRHRGPVEHLPVHRELGAGNHLIRQHSLGTRGKRLLLRLLFLLTYWKVDIPVHTSREYPVEQKKCVRG